MGNVLVSVSDMRIGVDTDGDDVYDYYIADVKSASDYYPFGMQMGGRKQFSEAMRYGFNGKEKDDEVKDVAGSSYDFEARSLYDSRLGRFVSNDPWSHKYPHQTPYAYFGNSPVSKVDWMGLGDYKDADGNLIKHVDDGIDQTITTDQASFTTMENKASEFGFDLNSKADAFLFSMMYEDWSKTPGTSISFSVLKEDPKYDSKKKENFYISHMDIDKTTQNITLTFAGETPEGVTLGNKSEISTGKLDSWSPNGEYSVWWISPNKSSNMSLNTYPTAVFAVKFNGNIATHYYNCPGYPASHGCARIKTKKFASLIWTFSKLNDTKVTVHGIWPGHKK